MQEKHIYEYSVIRVMPAVEREEFLNVGIIMFCKKAGFISVHCSTDRLRLLSFPGEFDIDLVQLNLDSLAKIARGEIDGGPIARLDLPSRFRWLTAVRSSSIQTSRPHPGLCNDLEQTAERLFKELVL
jgi:hypothetical protein